MQQENDDDHDDDPFRVILHIDLDSFYAQVESRRLGLPDSEPLVVQQWGYLLTVNYAARPYGITRNDNIEEAREKCPQLYIPHVETIGGEETKHALQRVDKSTQKAVLKRYRVASASIFAIFAQYADISEKASIDEMYLDVTDRITTQMKTLHGVYVHDEEDTCVIGGVRAVKDRWEQALHLGAKIASTIRKHVHTELQYTCSAGIAHNKMLAKLGSALKKPNGQTIIPHHAVQSLLSPLQVTSINGLGGKLGKLVTTTLRVKTIQEVQQYSLLELSTKLGNASSAEYVFWRVRGIDPSPVVEKLLGKSLISAKQFREGFTVDACAYWVSLLAKELSDRIEDDTLTNSRRPQRISISYSSATHSLRSKTLPFTSCDTLESLISSILRVLKENASEVYPCTSLLFTAKDFIDRSSVGTSQSISHYFGPSTRNTQAFPKLITNISPKQVPISLQVVSTPHKPFFPTTTNVQPTSIWKQNNSLSNISSLKEEVSTFWCPSCLRSLPSSESREHQDFHYALSLNKQSSSSTLIRTTPKVAHKRKAPENLLTLTSFFPKKVSKK